jgi:hypothetical protein
MLELKALNDGTKCWGIPNGKFVYTYKVIPTIISKYSASEKGYSIARVGLYEESDMIYGFMHPSGINSTTRSSLNLDTKDAHNIFFNSKTEFINSLPNFLKDFTDEQLNKVSKHQNSKYFQLNLEELKEVRELEIELEKMSKSENGYRKKIIQDYNDLDF